MKIKKLKILLIIAFCFYETECFGMQKKNEDISYVKDGARAGINAKRNFAPPIGKRTHSEDNRSTIIGDRYTVCRDRSIEEDTPVNILSIDGGGVRGIIPAVFLNKLEHKTGLKIHQMFDLIVGTSTGGILALGLTTPNEEGKILDSADMITQYTSLSKNIFPSSPWFTKPLYTIPSCFWWGSEYSEKPLEDELKKFLGDRELKDLKTPTVITSVDAQHNTLKLFRSYRARNDEENFLVRDVARATSAAPTYFPMKKITNIIKSDNITPTTFSVVDGGMAANNPSSIALSEAYSLFPGRPINLISLGTGKKSGCIRDPGDMIYAKRAAPTIEMLFDAQSDTVDTTLDILTNYDKTLNYHRIQIPLSEEYMSMDNADNVDPLKSLANQYYDKNKEEFVDISEALIDAIKNRKLTQKEKNLGDDTIIKVFEEPIDQSLRSSRVRINPRLGEKLK